MAKKSKKTDEALHNLTVADKMFKIAKKQGKKGNKKSYKLFVELGNLFQKKMIDKI